MGQRRQPGKTKPNPTSSFQSRKTKRQKETKERIQPEPRLPRTCPPPPPPADRRHISSQAGPSLYLIHKFTNNATVARQHNTGSRGVTVREARCWLGVEGQDSAMLRPQRVIFPRGCCYESSFPWRFPTGARMSDVLARLCSCTSMIPCKGPPSGL